MGCCGSADAPPNKSSPPKPARKVNSAQPATTVSPKPNAARPKANNGNATTSTSTKANGNPVKPNSNGQPNGSSTSNSSDESNKNNSSSSHNNSNNAGAKDAKVEKKESRTVLTPLIPNKPGVQAAPRKDNQDINNNNGKPRQLDGIEVVDTEHTGSPASPNPAGTRKGRSTKPRRYSTADETVGNSSFAEDRSTALLDTISPDHFLTVNPSMYGINLNMSLSLRSPPEGKTSKAPPDCTSIVRNIRGNEMSPEPEPILTRKLSLQNVSIRKTLSRENLRRESLPGAVIKRPLARHESLLTRTGDARRASLPLIAGIELAKSDSNLGMYMQDRDRDLDGHMVTPAVPRRASMLAEKFEKLGKSATMSPSKSNSAAKSSSTNEENLPGSILVRSPSQLAIDTQASCSEAASKFDIDEKREDDLTLHKCCSVYHHKRVTSITTEHLANTKGGHKYGIKISCCDQEPTKQKELDILQGCWEDSADNEWKVKGHKAVVKLKETGDSEVHVLVESEHFATLGRITLIDAFVARHEWSQIVWTDGDVWQQVWPIGTDVDVYYGDEEGWYGGKVKEHHENGTYSILFDDGEVADNVQGGHMRTREKEAVDTIHLLPPVNPHH
ncbi:hypothetical protein DIPPA_06928 [Diplonema papillatum]|nr:hypothetical protein DIPPA_06928 [Diplonema papillatum]